MMESTLPYILEHGPDELVAQLPQSTGEHSALTAFANRVLGEGRALELLRVSNQYHIIQHYI